MRSSTRPDRGLQARMLLTLFLLGAVYAVLMATVLAAGAGAITALAIGGGLFVAQMLLSERLALRAMGARVLEPADAPDLHGMVERLCLQADLPKPRLAVADNAAPNAFAMGRSRRHATVCVTTGIVELLSPAELEGVLAHELAHIRNRDVALMTVASFFASLASFLVQFGLFFGGGGEDEEEGGIGWLGLLAVSVGVYAISFFLTQALSRYREFAADRGAAELTGRPSALASALMRISGGLAAIPTRDLRAAELNAFCILPFRGGRSRGRLFATHPPMEQRIAALAQIEARMQPRPAPARYRELAGT